MKANLTFSLVALVCAGCGGSPASDAFELTPEPRRAAPSRPSGNAPIEPQEGESLPPATGASSGCAPPIVGGLLCDSFEAPLLGAAWTPVLVAGTVGIDKRHAHSGTQSLGVGFGAFPAAGSATVEARLPQLATTARAALRMHVELPVDGYPVRVPVGGLFDATGKGVALVIANSNALTVEDTSSGQLPRRLASFTFELGKWWCIALEVDRMSGMVHVELAGTKADVTVARELSFDRATLGTTYQGPANANASLGVHFDDVTVATTPLACP